MEKLVHQPENTPTSPDGLFEYEQPEPAPFEYTIFHDGVESTGQWVSGKKLRMDYLRTTDGLIQKITEGATITNPETGEQENQPYSTIVFLDKSARPVSHFVRETWPLFAKNIETGEIPPMPDFKFLNIDRRQWIDEIDPNWAGTLDANRIPETFIWSLRSLYLSPEDKQQVAKEGPTKKIEQLPASLDNQSILIIDETHYSGETLKAATGIMHRAFPTAHINSAYWMREKVDGKNRNPRWYTDVDNMGRGVNQRYAEVKKLLNAEEKNLHQRIGQFFLSAPHWRVTDGLRDTRYQQLIDEIKELSSHPDVPIIPSAGRKDEEMRIIAYNYPSIDVSDMTTDEIDQLVDRIVDQKRTIEDDSAHRIPSR